MYKRRNLLRITCILPKTNKGLIHLRHSQLERADCKFQHTASRKKRGVSNMPFENSRMDIFLPLCFLMFNTCSVQFIIRTVAFSSFISESSVACRLRPSEETFFKKWTIHFIYRINCDCTLDICIVNIVCNKVLFNLLNFDQRHNSYLI